MPSISNVSNLGASNSLRSQPTSGEPAKRVLTGRADLSSLSTRSLAPQVGATQPSGRFQEASDIAAETLATRVQLLTDSGSALTAQANSLPQGVLALLRG